MIGILCKVKLFKLYIMISYIYIFFSSIPVFFSSRTSLHLYSNISSSLYRLVLAGEDTLLSTPQLMGSHPAQQLSCHQIRSGVCRCQTCKQRLKWSGPVCLWVKGAAAWYLAPQGSTGASVCFRVHSRVLRLKSANLALEAQMGVLLSGPWTD